MDYLVPNMLLNLNLRVIPAWHRRVDYNMLSRCYDELRSDDE